MTRLHVALLVLGVGSSASTTEAQDASPILEAPASAGCEGAALLSDGSLRYGTRALGQLSADARRALRRRARHRAAALEVVGAETCVVALSLPRPRGMEGREPVTEMWLVSPSGIEHVGTFRAYLDSQASIDSQRIVGLRIHPREGSLSFQEVESQRSSCARRTSAGRFAPRRWSFHSKVPGEALTSGDEEPDGMWADCAERRRNAIPGATRTARSQATPSTAPANAPASVPTVIVRARVILAPGEAASELILWNTGRIQVGALESQVDLTLARIPTTLDGTEVDLSRVIRIRTRCFTDDENLVWISMNLQDQYEEDSFGRNVALIRERGRLSVVLSTQWHGAGWMTMESLGFQSRCGEGELSRLRVGERTFNAAGRLTQPAQHDWSDPVFSPVEREVYRRRRGGPLRLVEVQRTGFVFDRRSFAACPHVYVERNGQFEMSGEILRHMVGEEAYGDQGLTLGAVEDGVLRVELREEQHEVTYLDEVHLEVDGRPITPRECSGTFVPAFCDRDERVHVMRYGDVLPLHFDVPMGQAELRATGYYDAH